jgi:hypothetical protein
VFFLPFLEKSSKRNPKIHGIQNFCKKEEHGGFHQRGIRIELYEMKGGKRGRGKNLI